MAWEIAAGIAAFVLLAAGLALIGLAAWIVIQRHQKVALTSRALAEAAVLGRASQQMLSYAPPISVALQDRVSSKAKLDRYDLEGLLRAHLEVVGPQVQALVRQQLKDVDTFTRYDIEFGRVGSRFLGHSSADGVPQDTYVRIEARKFRKQRLREPRCQARVRCAVSYTSPQGRNSYQRTMEWDFHGLVRVLREVEQQSVLKATETYRRKLERSRMTTALRFEILQRDGRRCRACGASAAGGASLHVDHIVPIAKGARP